MGLKAPNHTQTPNELFDEWLPLLGLAELKVLMVIIRKTFGWHKIRDRISLSQLELLTGLGRRHVLKATKTLVEKHLISKSVEGKKGTQSAYYELVVDDVSNNVYQCPKDTPPSVLKTPTKETLSKEKETPIVPKRDLPSSSKSRKRIPEEKKERSSRVLISDTQHEDLLTKANRDETLLKSWYDKLSTWKIGKGFFGGANDYQSITNWVIQAVKEAPKSETERKEELTGKNRDLAQKIKKMYPQSKDILVGVSYIEFDMGPMLRPHIKFSDNGFEEQVFKNLKDMNLWKEELWNKK